VNKLHIASHPKFVFRVGRGDPWIIRPPRGHNRFDIFDPDESVMTLYTGESPEAALSEVLAPFRPDLETIAAVEKIPCDDDRNPLAGRVPKSWLAERRIGQARIRSSAVIIDITNPFTIQALRNEPQLAQQALRSGFKDLDDSALKASDDKGRHLTQKIAAFIYNLGHSGIRYESRLGSSYKCIAGFVHLSASDAASSAFLEQTIPAEPISPLDPILQKVAAIFNLKLPYVVI
jgi:RES domain